MAARLFGTLTKWPVLLCCSWDGEYLHMEDDGCTRKPVLFCKVVLGSEQRVLDTHLAHTDPVSPFRSNRWKNLTCLFHCIWKCGCRASSSGLMPRCTIAQNQQRCWECAVSTTRSKTKDLLQTSRDCSVLHVLM